MGQGFMDQSLGSLDFLIHPLCYCRNPFYNASGILPSIINTSNRKEFMASKGKTLHFLKTLIANQIQFGNHIQKAYYVPGTLYTLFLVLTVRAIKKVLLFSFEDWENEALRCQMVCPNSHNYVTELGLKSYTASGIHLLVFLKSLVTVWLLICV